MVRHRPVGHFGSTRSANGPLMAVCGRTVDQTRYCSYGHATSTTNFFFVCFYSTKPKPSTNTLVNWKPLWLIVRAYAANYSLARWIVFSVIRIPSIQEGSAGNDVMNTASALDDGGVVVAGWSYGTTWNGMTLQGESDFAAVKLANNGTVMWRLLVSSHSRGVSHVCPTRSK